MINKSIYDNIGKNKHEFRVWNIFNKQFVYWDLIGGDRCLWNEKEHLTRSNANIHRYGHDEQTVLEIFPITKYTGLKDINKVKIFEGDIVTASNDDKLGTYVITWSNELVTYCLSENSFYLGDAVKDYFIEVIGNIYENPELLESHHGNVFNI